MTESGATERNKLSRRKKARAKRTLHKAFEGVLSEIDSDQFLRSHLFLNRPHKNKLVVGGYIVVKQDNSTYNVYKKNMQNLLYEKLYSFDAAMAIAESLNAGKNSNVAKILREEEIYMQAYNDIIIYRYQYNAAIQNKSGNEAILEDRYILAVEKAKAAHRNLRRFRIAPV